LNTNQSFIFIGQHDEFAGLINEQANLLYHRLKTLDISKMDFDEFGTHYFSSHHGGKRLFFSIQSSAGIIYQSVKMINKPVSEINFIDYGAGLGTLCLLASQLGFKGVYYNDYLELWTINAHKLFTNLNISIAGFITGDIDAVIDYGQSNNIVFDIVGSRNVVEHIYNLREFYTKLYQSGITTVCYSTTTANYHNIAMRLKHYWYHRKVENAQFKKQRAAYIKELKPDVTEEDLTNLVEVTRGRAFADFTNAVDLYYSKKPIPPVEFLGTNTCDYHTGIWAENLLTRKNYFEIIRQSGFTVEYTAGFWDTHYKYPLLNSFTALLNRFIKILGKNSYWLAPFVNVTAIKK
jgi:2-polyprenyl-3-methyl-5-hydroxy-6-metoxy-1,4-benzoquinol methylase